MKDKEDRYGKRNNHGADYHSTPKRLIKEYFSFTKRVLGWEEIKQQDPVERFHDNLGRLCSTDEIRSGTK
jgi:hypothetical protein